MRLDFSFIDPDSPRWSEALGATRHDFYHLPSYDRLAGRLEGGEAMAFVAAGGACSMPPARTVIRACCSILGPRAGARSASSIVSSGSSCGS
jgi:hypothetical protein